MEVCMEEWYKERGEGGENCSCNHKDMDEPCAEILSLSKFLKILRSMSA